MKSKNIIEGKLSGQSIKKMMINDIKQSEQYLRLSIYYCKSSEEKKI
ncbi:unnamed protein product [Paramecium octaurelia]|uniref:Uncharacterized protein n=1 Tax=Paramecium octaurelia TaxID=43137 RepID=A0A8S1VLP0_PAROT|nr:unnamed protein product [Paramecium octaurelia]